ncbi:hypothetical protein R1flu_009982 [Riccia fluitans]|uniref:Ribosomal protein S14 n=1 Tax=Riccia fluitans TaxID=41844 RepID=A0ABD1Z4H4_9MARC
MLVWTPTPPVDQRITERGLTRDKTTLEETNNSQAYTPIDPTEGGTRGVSSPEQPVSSSRNRILRRGRYRDPSRQYDLAIVSSPRLPKRHFCFHSLSGFNGLRAGPSW